MTSRNEVSGLLQWRMRSQLLIEPAGTISAAVSRMLAVQSQDLAAGRYAVAQRASKQCTRAEVDAEFNAGAIVRAWTMRGTLHICAAEDFHWLIAVTRERTVAALASQRGKLGITATDSGRAEKIIGEHLQEHGCASRSELLRQLADHGVNVEAQRGYHLLMAAVLDGLMCLGPVPAASGLSAQNFVLADAWIKHPRTVAYPIQELVMRYLGGHAPASARDIAWYTGQTLTSIRQAIARLGDQLAAAAHNERGEELYAAASQMELWEAQKQHSLGQLPLRLLGPFDEYYLSYADRSPVADDAVRSQIGPGSNGMVKAFWLRQGRAAGPWNADAAPTDRLGAALHQRYLGFRT